MPKSIDDMIKEMHEKRMSKTEKDIEKATKKALKIIGNYIKKSPPPPSRYSLNTAIKLWVPLYSR